ncbi:MAG TPA: hypothetical protein DF613_00300 [Lachnospiraceae bacterium]|nr:hypothetical protein [Lachnospiraceae bacterium]
MRSLLRDQGLCIFLLLCKNHIKAEKTTRKQHKHKTIQINHQKFGYIVLFIFWGLCYNKFIYAPENIGGESCSRKAFFCLADAGGISMKAACL